MKITRDNLKKAQERIDKLQTLDQNEIEPLLDAFHSESRVFILNNFSGQGNRDLYMLANIRGNFSEADIGQIALQIMNQLKYLHEHGVVCKYLTPQNIVVNSGFQPGQPIQLKITDLAMMQLIDVAYPALHEKISGIDRIFLAPEVITNTQTVPNPRSDTWSLGIILYLLITGGL